MSGYDDSRGHHPHRDPWRKRDRDDQGSPYGRDAERRTFGPQGRYGSPSAGEDQAWRRDRYGARTGQDRGDYGSGYDRDQGGYGRGTSDYQATQHQGEFDPDYLHWREEQMRSHDRDYEDWRRTQHSRYDEDYHAFRGERRDQFGESFQAWRSQRNVSTGAATHALPNDGGDSGITTASAGGVYSRGGDDKPNGYLEPMSAMTSYGRRAESSGGSGGSSTSSARSGPVDTSPEFNKEPGGVQAASDGVSPDKKR